MDDDDELPDDDNSKFPFSHNAYSVRVLRLYPVEMAKVLAGRKFS